MWLLKLHFSISVLCFLAFLGIREVYKDEIKENGYENNGKKKKIWIFFAPGINILMVITILLMAGMKKGDLEKKLNEMKNNREVSDND